MNEADRALLGDTEDLRGVISDRLQVFLADERGFCESCREERWTVRDGLCQTCRFVAHCEGY